MTGGLDELGDEVIEEVLPLDGEVELVRAIFADFLKCVEAALVGVVQPDTVS